MTALGPAASALRDRLVAEIAAGTPPPGERLGAERELAARLRREPLDPACGARLARGGGRRAPRPRPLRWDLRLPAARGARPQRLTGLPAYLRRQGFQSGARVLSTGTVPAGAETAGGSGTGRGRARARGAPTAAGGRAARVARASPLPGRSLPGAARPLARRVDLRPARDGVRARGRRGRGADRGRGRDDGGRAHARGAAGRPADLDRADGLDGRRTGRSSIRATCSGPTGCASSPVSAAGTPRRSERPSRSPARATREILAPRRWPST